VTAQRRAWNSSLADTHGNGYVTDNLQMMMMMMCAQYYEDQFKLLKVTEENQADIFGDIRYLPLLLKNCITHFIY